MIEKARKIIKKRLFTTTKDYNTLIDGLDFLEQAAKENRDKLTPLQRKAAIDKLTAKLEKAQRRTLDRMSQGRSRGGTAGTLNRDIHNLGFTTDEIQWQINILKNNQ